MSAAFRDSATTFFGAASLAAGCAVAAVWSPLDPSFGMAFSVAGCGLLTAAVLSAMAAR